MPKLLFHGSYTADGVKGVLKDGGTGRYAAVKEFAESLGGTLEAMYFAFGTDDFYVIASLPDEESAVAVSMTSAASGATRLRTAVLFTPEQIDTAAKKTPVYRRPGG